MASGTITPSIDLAGYNVKIYPLDDYVFDGFNYTFRHGLGNITDVQGFLSSRFGLIGVNLYISGNPDYLTLVGQHANLNGSWQNPISGHHYNSLLIVFYK